MNTIKKLDILLRDGFIHQEDITALQKVVGNFSFAISEQLYKRIDKSNECDPLVKQFIPTKKELDVSHLELADPIGDNVHMPVKGIVHRYPDRCLLMPVQVCPVYCRFCFRKEKVGTADATLSEKELQDAYAYIRHHQEIWEVILTGGDPLILKPQVLRKIISQLNSIEHVEVMRIHTRIPVVESRRINQEMVAVLKNAKPIYVVLHANHPNEFTEEAVKACSALVDAGIPMLSQTTLLKDINDNIEVLSALMRCFIRNRIKPYYLHHADLAKGTQHFRTTLAEGQHLVKQLRGRFSGICQPTYVLDIPGGYGKVPVGPCYIRQTKNNTQEVAEYCVEDYCGGVHVYPCSLREESGNE
ncbi:MAG: lysine 2,3-aminomutase [Gammaproteobacteria bacterium RIFCSPHIGHO2_12_FULL_41_20]|nr:MAG: lysine 2,3-aminomutase [Gammaproteobacteria bacterium RIFCSPHIGHO2_12_FULL_41_20]